MSKAATVADAELADDMGRFYDDPVGFARYAFRWGEDDLQGFEWLDTWQEDYLAALGFEVELRGFDGVKPVAPIRMATASGHGIGKSALVAIAILWVMSTRPFCRGVVTANTAVQLRTKTWAELAKWRRRCIAGHWFELNVSTQSLSLYHIDYPELWRVDGQTSREENSEAFAGLHAASSTPFFIFDEASGIPEKIFEVAQGGLTDGEPMFLMFGNPTRNNGSFYDAVFGRMRHRWIGRSIDSRTCRTPNKGLIKQWVEDYGEDSDFVRVRVRGLPPAQAALQFINADDVRRALGTTPVHQMHERLVVGVDVARFGDDRSVIYTRHGRDAQTWRPQVFRGLSTMQFAARVHEHWQRLGGRNAVGAVFVDGIGVGGGVVDRLIQLGVPNVIEVNFGGKANQGRYANKRAECYGNLRDWLALSDVALWHDKENLGSDFALGEELVAIEYGYTLDNKIKLEPKEDLKDRLGYSPDLADALALTFAEPLAPADAPHPGGRTIHEHDYDPFNQVS